MEKSSNLLQIPPCFKNSSIDWLDDITMSCPGAKLRLVKGFVLEPSEEPVITFFKGPKFVQLYLEILSHIEIERIVEIGAYDGGSSIFFWNLLKPKMLCCIEKELEAPQLTKYIESQALQSQFHTHFGVDQGDVSRLREIMRTDFDGEALDVVIDDASHLYGPSRASFESLFPLLRSGGVYIIEDWKTSLFFPRHGGGDEPDSPPLHQLVFELLEASMRNTGYISSIRVENDLVVFTRGPEPADPTEFSLDRLFGNER